jgi:hypothetical protein
MGGRYGSVLTAAELIPAVLVIWSGTDRPASIGMPPLDWIIFL